MAPEFRLEDIEAPSHPEREIDPVVKSTAQIEYLAPPQYGCTADCGCDGHGGGGGVCRFKRNREYIDR